MSRVRLGELLVSRGRCTREHLLQAWEMKVLYGDRLGTNLLALGVIDEVGLAEALGVQHGVHAGHGAVLRVDPAAVAALPTNVAARRQVVPHHIVDRTLYLLMKDPEDLRAIDDVRFATGLNVQPIVVCEARLWRLLGHHYQLKTPLRPNPLDVRRASPTPASPTDAPADEAPADLVSEEEFNSLYARIAAGHAHDDAALPDDVSSPTLRPPSGPSWTSPTSPSVPQRATAAPSPVPSNAPTLAPPWAESREAAGSTIPEVTAEASSEMSLAQLQALDGPPVVEVPDWSDSTRPMRLRLVAGVAMPDGPDEPERDRAPPPARQPSAHYPTIEPVTATDSSSSSSSLSSLPLSASTASSPPTASSSPAVMSSPLSAPIGKTEDWQRVLVTNPMRAVPRSLQAGLLDEVELLEVVDDAVEARAPRPASPFDGLPLSNSSQIAPLPPDMSPLPFDTAVELLKTASGRDDIARIVLRAAKARFARACLLTVYPHAFVGFQGVGDGYETERLVDVSLPRDAPSVFQLVAESRAHHLGPLQKFAIHGAWIKATGRKLPKSIAVLPVLVRGRCVNLLVVDNGHDQHVDSDVGELLILSRHIAGSYEQLIQRG